MNYECNPKKVTRGFPGSPPRHTLKPKNWGFMKPTFPPVSGNAYELTSTGHLSATYWKNKEREALEANGGIIVPLQPSQATFAVTTPDVKVSTSFNKLESMINMTDLEMKLSQVGTKEDVDEERYANIARVRAQEASPKKENIRPKGSIFRMEKPEDDVYKGAVLTDKDRETFDEFAERHYREELGRRLDLRIKMDTNYGPQRNWLNVMNGKDFATAWLMTWIKSLGNYGPYESAFNSESKEALIQADAIDDDATSAGCSTPYSGRLCGEEYEPKYEKINVNLPEATTCMTATEETTTHGNVTIGYTGAPGDCSAFNSRAHRSAADLEFAIHRKAMKSDNPKDHDYEPEVRPDSREYDPNKLSDLEKLEKELEKLNEEEKAKEMKKPREDPMKIDVAFHADRANY